MKMYVEADEHYPFYELSEKALWPSHTEVDVSEKFYAVYKRVMEEFSELQKELRKLAGD